MLYIFICIIHSSEMKQHYWCFCSINYCFWCASYFVDRFWCQCMVWHLFRWHCKHVCLCRYRHLRWRSAEML